MSQFRKSIVMKWVALFFLAVPVLLAPSALKAVEEPLQQQQHIDEATLSQQQSQAPTEEDKIKKGFCDKVNERFVRFGWSKVLCNDSTWRWDRKYTTAQGNPLLYQVFNEQSTNATTLVMCGVHGNESSSIYQCLYLTREILYDDPKSFVDAKVVIAPIVNPDGFLAKVPRRANSNGIDLNRNFPTNDFDSHATKEWKSAEGGAKDKYPGKQGGSEIETQFQIMLIERFNPDKIISVHSPFGWLDVDTPEKTGKPLTEPDGFNFKEISKQAKDMAQVMSRASNNFKVKDFRVYPGSLGNYAAREKGIPTYTLELESSDAVKGFSYWQRLRKAFVAAIQYKFNRIPPATAPAPDAATAAPSDKVDISDKSNKPTNIP